MRRDGFATFAWSALAANLGVIVWGAYVRATGSGAGCGHHWPLCNGEVVPRAPTTATLIELAHRVSSGIVLVLAVLLVVWAWRARPARDPARRGAALVLVFTLTEALVGAGLVLLRLVGQNASVARAVYMGAHLTNTFFLLAALTLTAQWASGLGRLRLRDRSGTAWLVGIGLLVLLVTGIGGAIAALGDTLFPAASLGAGLRRDFAPASHFLVRLRAAHPVLAVAAGAYVLTIASVLARDARGPARALLGLVTGQLALGALNLALMAPVWLQLVHLLLADLVWITLLAAGARALAAAPSTTRVEVPLSPRAPAAPSAG